MSDETRIALLAGGGMSVDAGLPTSDQLAGRLRQRLIELAQGPEGSSDELVKKSHAEDWLALYNFLDGGIRFQEGVLNRDPDRPVNIEQIAVAAEELQARTTNPLAAYVAGWHARLQEIEQRIPSPLRSFVDFTYSRLQEWLALDDQTRASYLRGLGELCIEGAALDIFSLNYDLCVETALSAAGVKFVNGFDSEGVWSRSSFEDPAQIRLYKLHGSLDWVDDQVYGLCSLQFPRHESSDTIQGDDVRPLLIFGTAHKLSAREPFLTLAYHFSQRVLSTRVLAVIGYSFGDEHINQIIEQGLRRNGKLRIVVVSPQAEERVRSHRFLYRNPRISIIARSAKTALNDRLLTDRLRDILKDVSTEAPFS